MAILETEVRGAVLVARFNHASANNPMSRELENAVVAVCQDVEDNPAIKALVMTGGNGRSFCAGGDFSEVGQISGRVAVEAFIDRLITLYCAVLQVTKPTVAAVGGYAIGIGFQVALSCDWRLGSSSTKLLMWELKHGLACSIGGYMLESFLGRAAMTDIIYGCEAVPLAWAVQHRLLHEIVDAGELTEKGIARAQILAEYPEITYRRTKESVNRPFIDGLNAIVKDAKEAHVAGFASKAAEQHFKRVLRQ